MDRDSKRRNKAQKTIKAKLPALPIETLEKLAQIPNSWKFPESVTNMPLSEDAELIKFHLCFDYFNWNTCVWSQFDDVKTKAIIRIFESVTKCEVRKFPELKLIRDSITNTPTYSSLFENVSPEVDMKETEIPGSGRMFFFISDNHFNVVSIESKHRNH